MVSGPSETIRRSINGAFTEVDASSHLDVLNPASRELVGRAPLSRASEVDKAVAAARAAAAREHGEPLDASRGDVRRERSRRVKAEESLQRTLQLAEGKRRWHEQFAVD